MYFIDDLGSTFSIVPLMLTIAAVASSTNATLSVTRNPPMLSRTANPQPPLPPSSLTADASPTDELASMSPLDVDDDVTESVTGSAVGGKPELMTSSNWTTQRTVARTSIL